MYKLLGSRLFFRFFGVFFLVLPTLLSGVAVNAQEPGTSGDPLITRSYIDQFFRFRSMVIPAGEKLQLVQGALLVARSGRLKFRGAKNKTLIDLTDGKEISPDSFIPPCHLIMVPDSGDNFLEAQTLGLILAVGIMPRK